MEGAQAGTVRAPSATHAALAVHAWRPASGLAAAAFNATERRRSRPIGRGRAFAIAGDLVQLYVRDPAGNLVESDCVGIDRLPAELRAQLKHLWDFHPQEDANMRARLFVPE